MIERKYWKIVAVESLWLIPCAPLSPKTHGLIPGEGVSSQDGAFGPIPIASAGKANSLEIV